MNYKLIPNSLNNIDDIQTTILNNRNIFNIDEFLNINKSNCLNYNLLDNINEAVECLIKHIEINNKICIIVDCDTDGVCSAAMLYKYIKKYNPLLNITYLLHQGKQHGLSDDIIIPDDTNLILIPDAGSNDFEKHSYYKSKGIDIICLDHHETDKYSNDAIVVNNQLSKKYTNKYFCGAGVTYKFLKALDDELWETDADNYLDLVMLANIGDMMDSRSLETRWFMLKGLKQIKSNMLQAFIDKQNYSIGDCLTLISIAFYIVPLINACMRLGSQDLKELMFKAFIDDYYEFDYKKRTGEVVKETIYERVARECVNVKKRQDTQTSNVLNKIISYIEDNQLDKNKVIIANVNDLLTQELTGLLAMQITKIYKRPVILYRNRKVDDIEIFSGSARNYSNYELQNLKNELSKTNLFYELAGHSNAFGVSFYKEKLNDILNEINKSFPDYSNDILYLVDLIIPFEYLDDNYFIILDNMKSLWGQSVEEPMIAITDIDVLLNKVEIIEGKKGSTVKFNIDGVEIIRFKVSEDDELLRVCQDWDYELPEATIDIIGRIGINAFKGIKKKQIIVTDWKLKGSE